jgi:predicted nucleic acid-binding protein
MINYFDSSFLLAILFEENKQNEALRIWKGNPIRVSSVLLDIETNISLKRYHKQLKHKLGENWLDKKKLELKNFLDNVFFNEVTGNFAKSMRGNDKLAHCKSLDAIHIATALNIRENNDVTICSYDKNMLKIAKELGFETSGI